MTERVRSRADLRPAFNHYFNADGDPGIPEIASDEIHLSYDTSQNGWRRFTHIFREELDIDISGNINYVVYARDNTVVRVVEGLRITMRVAGTAATAIYIKSMFNGIGPGMRYGNAMLQNAVADQVYVSPGTFYASSGTPTGILMPVSWQVCWPGQQLELNVLAGIATEVMDIAVWGMQAPGGAEIPRYR